MRRQVHAALALLAGLELIGADGAPYVETHAGAPATLVGIWATWCPSCRQELPELVALGRELAPRGVRLLLVSVDRVPARAARYLGVMGYGGEAAYDPGAASAERLGVRGIPAVLVVDAAGTERARVVGSGDGAAAKLRAAVERVLEEGSHAE